MLINPSPICLCGAELRRTLGDTGSHYSRCYLFYRCERCDLISPDPLPTAEELSAQYTGYGRYGDPDQLARDEALKRVQARRLVARLRRLLGPRFEGARLLEVGCAAGALLEQLGAHGGLDVQGVEPDPVNAGIAQRRLGSKVRVGSLDSARYEPASFDVVYAEQVIEHVPRADELLVACARVLRGGGVLLLSTPNFDGLSARLLRLGWKEFLPTEHVRMFTARALRFHLSGAGFERIRVETQGVSLIRRRDRADLLGRARKGVAARVLSRTLGLAGLGDGLSACAFKPAEGAPAA